MSSINLSVQQLRQAADLKEKISALEKQLSQILGSTAIVAAKAPKKKGGMSAAGRARVAAAQKARWAKIKSGKPVAKVAQPAKKKFTMSAAAKAKLSAAAKARWAKVKATKPAVKAVVSSAPKKKGGISAEGRARMAAAAKARWAAAKAAGKKTL